MNFIFLLGILFVFSSQPMFMVSMLILITLVYSYNIYNVMSTFWFSYILLMVMLSGVLVVFTYMVTLVPNEKFEMYSLVILLMLMLTLYLYMNCNLYTNMSMISMNLWITFMGIMNLFLVGYLLGMMLLVIVLSYLGDGAFHIN